MDDVIRPRKCHALDDRVNIPDSGEDGSGEVMNEEISQDQDNTSSDSTPAVVATLAAVMSFMHTKGIDEQGEAGDVVEEDVGRNGNEDDENENEEQGRVGDVVNQSHT